MNINLDFHILTWLNNILFCVGPEKCWSSQNVWTILTMFSEFNKQFRLTISVVQRTKQPKHSSQTCCCRQIYKNLKANAQTFFMCKTRWCFFHWNSFTLQAHVDESIIIHDYWSVVWCYIDIIVIILLMTQCCCSTKSTNDHLTLKASGHVLKSIQDVPFPPPLDVTLSNVSFNILLFAQLFVISTKLSLLKLIHLVQSNSIVKL